MSETFTITNARLVCPACGYDGPGALRVEEGVIAEAGPDVAVGPNGGARVIDAGGRVLAPAFVDLSARIGAGENVETLALQALSGGVGAIVAAPGPDAPFARGPVGGGAEVLRAASLLEGGALQPIAGLIEAGARVLTVRAAEDARTLLRALTYAAPFERPILLPPGMPSLDEGALLGEGATASLLGLLEALPESEAIGLHAHALLAKRAGARVIHGPVTTAAGFAMAGRLAEEDAENAPPVFTDLAHCLFNDVDAGGLDPRYRLHPPLKSEADRQASLAAIRGGSAILASGHAAPAFHRGDTFEEAEPGAVTAPFFLNAVLSLHHDHGLSLLDVFHAASLAPARALDWASGRLTRGAPADLILFDPDAPARMETNGRSPFSARRLQGRLSRMWLGGRDMTEGAT